MKLFLIINRLLLVYFLLLPIPELLGEIVKCIGPDGDIIYSNSNCPQGYSVKKSIYEENGSSSSKNKSYSHQKNNFKKSYASGEVGRNFNFDGFNWQIKNVHKFRRIGSDSYPKKPKNDYFLVIEVVLKNISSKPRYITSDMKLISGDNQYDWSSTAHTFPSHQLGYENERGTIEPGIRIREFFGFDVKASYNFTLIISEWGVSGNRVRVNIH